MTAEDARKRGVKSPDPAEAVMLAFAEDWLEWLEWLRSYARRIGEWRRDTTEAGSAGPIPSIRDWLAEGVEFELPGDFLNGQSRKSVNKF